MLFNSLTFAIFLPIVFLFYWFVFNRNFRLQNLFVVVASYVFYAWWDWRFLFLLIFSTALDYLSSIQIFNAKTQGKKKMWLLISMIINLGFLGYFKYYNFFVSSFADLLQTIGLQANISTLKIMIPVGISFYTFHGVSYVLDIYHGKIQPTRNVIDYSLFVSFFPLLVAGPIERATHLLPQLKKPRTFDYSKAVDGMRQILWGLFKKIVIADNCAALANQIFSNYESCSGSTLALGALFFTFQIYSDFSGYSDIATGIGKLFGIELLHNFNFPYFSRDIAEFWRRWHISLTTWFRDYIYIPLGGSRVSKGKVVRNTFVIFLVSGFWHGANWTFICWGAYHALLFLPLILLNINRRNIDVVAKGKRLPSFKECFQMATTFGLVVLGWILFRAESITEAWHYISTIFSKSLLTVPERSDKTYITIFFAAVLILVEWINREKQHGLQIENIKSSKVKYLIYISIILTIWAFGGQQETFIYFQF